MIVTRNAQEGREETSSDCGDGLEAKCMVPRFSFSGESYRSFKLANKGKGVVGGILGRSRHKPVTRVRIDAGLGHHSGVSEASFSLPSVA